MFKSFLSNILIPGNKSSESYKSLDTKDKKGNSISRKRKDFTTEYAEYIIKDEKIVSPSDSSEASKFEYHFLKNRGSKFKFNPKKPTIVYFHVNCGFDFEQFRELKQLGYNAVGFPFYGYGESEEKSIECVTLDHLVQQSKVVLGALEEDLRSEKCYGEYYDRKEHLILVGRSLGTLVATKLAAEMEKEGQQVNRVINCVSPINLSVAIKTFVYRNWCPFLILTLAIYGCVLDIGIRLLFQLFAKKEPSTNLIITNVVLIPIFLFLVPALMAKIFQDAKQIGISKDEISNLQKTDVRFIHVENDLFCNEPDLDKLLEGTNSNIKKYKISETNNGQVKLEYQDANNKLVTTTLYNLKEVAQENSMTEEEISIKKPSKAHNFHFTQNIALKVLLRRKPLSVIDEVEEKWTCSDIDSLFATN